MVDRPSSTPSCLTAPTNVRSRGHHLGMGIDNGDTNRDEVGARLRGLLQTAKAEDELEFACTLMRVRGMEDLGWDPFVETQQLVADLTNLIGQSLVPYTKVRLGLLLYSHLTEVGSMYEILANLTRVIARERYAIDPFFDHYPRNRKGEPQFLSTPGKVRVLKEMLTAVGHPAVVEVLDWFFNASVRNAFAHADYTLHEGWFRARSERSCSAASRARAPLAALADLLDRAMAFYSEIRPRARRAARKLPRQQSHRRPTRRGLRPGTR